MALKMKQMMLSFSPLAKLPALRHEGACVVPGVDPPPPLPSDSEMSMGPEPPPEKKARRDLTLQAKGEILKYHKEKGTEATLIKFPEISESALQRLPEQATVIRQAVVNCQWAWRHQKTRPIAKIPSTWGRALQFF